MSMKAMHPMFKLGVMLVGIPIGGCAIIAAGTFVRFLLTSPPEKILPLGVTFGLGGVVAAGVYLMSKYEHRSPDE